MPIYEIADVKKSRNRFVRAHPVLDGGAGRPPDSKILPRRYEAGLLPSARPITNSRWAWTGSTGSARFTV